MKQTLSATTIWGIFLSAIGVMIASALITSVFVWLAWNAVIPQVFGLPQIDLLQGFALSILGNALIKTTTTK